LTTHQRGNRISGNAASSLIVEVEPDITAPEMNELIEDLAGAIGVREGGATIVLPSSRSQPLGKETQYLLHRRRDSDHRH
jgi:hypothetical protein